MPAMHTNLGSREDGISPAGVDFYVARAKGGYGMVGVGIIDSYPFEFSSPHELFLQNERHVAVHRGLVEQIKAQGALAFAQIGVRRIWPLHEMRKLPRCSSLPAKLIRDMVDAVVRTAVLAREAGYDMVDLLGNGGGAISIFLSQVFNDRTDEWGGDAERRLRFVKEIVAGIRRECGADFPITMRLHGGEFLAGGYSVSIAKQNALALAAAGVALFNVTGGSHATTTPQLTPNVPQAGYAFLAREIKLALRGAALVAASNRITDPFAAEELLRKGWADVVSLGRQALADPEWPNKVRAGEFEEVRRCIACNECLDIATVYEQPVRCLVNPAAGRISEASPLPQAAEPKRVMVIGGGVAGLQAALTCAQRGHRVTLYERSDVLGGRWQVAFAPPGREELFHFLRWLVHQVKKHGVALRTGVDVTPELVRSEAPDVVVVCAGARPRRPDLPGADLPHVVLAEDVLTGKANVGERVVVVGGGGVGVETALFLARRWETDPRMRDVFREFGSLDAEVEAALDRRGHRVTVLGRNKQAGVGLGPATRWVLVKEVEHAGGEVLPSAAVEAITPEGVLVSDREGRRLIPADTVVLAVGYESDDGLVETVRALGVPVYALGDAVEVQHAIAGVGAALEIGLQV